MEEADRHCLGPGHPMEVSSLEADEVDVFSGYLLLYLLHGWYEPLISRALNTLVIAICGKKFESLKYLQKHTIEKSDFKTLVIPFWQKRNFQWCQVTPLFKLDKNQSILKLNPIWEQQWNSLQIYIVPNWKAMKVVTNEFVEVKKTKKQLNLS